MKIIYESSEHLQEMLNDEEDITDEKILSVLNKDVQLLKYKISVTVLIEILNELLNYKNIEYDEHNISAYVDIFNYFLMENKDDFHKFIINDFVFKKNITTNLKNFMILLIIIFYYLFLKKMI